MVIHIPGWSASLVQIGCLVTIIKWSVSASNGDRECLNTAHPTYRTISTIPFHIFLCHCLRVPCFSRRSNPTFLRPYHLKIPDRLKSTTQHTNDEQNQNEFGVALIEAFPFSFQREEDVHDIDDIEGKILIVSIDPQRKSMKQLVPWLHSLLFNNQQSGYEIEDPWSRASEFRLSGYMAPTFGEPLDTSCLMEKCDA